MLRVLLVNEMEERVRIKRLRITRLRLRDNENPFNLSAHQFEEYYRLPKHLVHSLIEQIQPSLRMVRRSTAIPHHLQVLSFLSVVANGGYQKNVGHDFLLPLSQPWISRHIDVVSTAIDTVLSVKFIKFPQTVAEINSVKSVFYRKFGFPGVIGAIDCTHIAIQKPDESVEHAYYSGRKKAHTKNVQIICDYNLNILNINARYGGTAHDSYVFSNSQIKTHLMELYDNGTINTWLIGDSGYEQRPWLMTPIRHTSNIFEDAYNVAHRATRNCVERCIGVLKGRFRILGKDRLMRYSPQKCGTIINACAVLHNMMVNANVPFNFDLNAADDINEEEDRNTAPSNNILERGILIRNNLIN